MVQCSIEGSIRPPPCLDASQGERKCGVTFTKTQLMWGREHMGEKT